MRLERNVEGKSYWIELKDRFTPRDLRSWERALKPDPARVEEILSGEGSDDEKQDHIIMATHEAALSLLGQWSAGCYLVDTKGTEYHHVKDVTPDALWDFDAPLVEMVLNAGTEAYHTRSVLGNRRGGRS